MQFGVMSVSDITRDPVTGYTPSEAERIDAVKTIAVRYRKAGRFPTKYWTPEVHVAAFALPRFIADKVAKAGKR